MAHMKVRYLGETSFLELTQGKVYEVISVEKGWYRLIDDSGEDYLYSLMSSRLFLLTMALLAMNRVG